MRQAISLAIDRVRINKYKGAFLWDVQLNGADRKAIERKKAEYSYPPEPGSVIYVDTFLCSP